MSSIKMEYAYYKEVEQAKKEHWPVLIPIGTMEYHSTICPYGCDSLVAKGVIDKIAEKIDCVVMPTVYYGVASYAVKGPEKGSIQVDCDTFENYIYCILKSLLLSGFNRNIYMVLAHQTEDYNPMELACMKAARKLIFEYLEKEQGYGWWGNNSNKEFYENISAMDNPWNWIKTLRELSPHVMNDICDSDHAGKKECGILEYLYPNTVKLDRINDTDDWFSRDAIEMDVNMGKLQIETTVDEYVELIKKQMGK